jgi:hypothetical protein
MIYSFRDKNKITVEKFLDNVRALESYHRSIYKTIRIPEEKYQMLAEKVLNIEGLDKEGEMGEWF